MLVSLISQSENCILFLVVIDKKFTKVRQYHSCREPAYMCIEPVSHTCSNPFIFDILNFLCYLV